MKIKLFLFLVLSSIHVFLLLISRNYITPELIFPVWLISNSQNFVSEIQFFYPPVLPLILSFINKATSNLYFSFSIVQISLVLFIDAILFAYLNNKFKFKYVIIGFLFYIPWQVFFRGNYLWYDFATLPFLIISFIYFEKYVKNRNEKNLLLSSLALSFGYFFKITVFWVYALYLFWLAYINSKNISSLIKDVVILLVPLIFAAAINVLILLLSGTFEFTLYWHIIMQNFVYPRISTLPRSIQPEYYLPLILLLLIFAGSVFTIEKYSKSIRNNKLFLYSFTIVSMANIIPRWSDFRVQPFVLFLTIVFTNSIYLLSLKKNNAKLYTSIYFLFILFASFVILGNRVIIEANNRDVFPYNIEKYAPNNLKALVLNKNIFVYDYAFYNKYTYNIDNLRSIEKIWLSAINPDKFFSVTGWQIALNYVKTKDPDIIIIPKRIQNNISKNKNLSPFEEFVIKKYHSDFDISNEYYFYVRE